MKQLDTEECWINISPRKIIPRPSENLFDWDDAMQQCFQSKKNTHFSLANEMALELPTDKHDKAMLQRQ